MEEWRTRRPRYQLRSCLVAARNGYSRLSPDGGASSRAARLHKLARRLLSNLDVLVSIMVSLSSEDRNRVLSICSEQRR